MLPPDATQINCCEIRVNPGRGDVRSCPRWKKIDPVALQSRIANDRLRLGRFELWPSRQQLLRDGHPCRIGGRALDLLTVLAHNAHRTVSRDELLDLVWPGLAVEPNNLQVQICALRKLLGARSIVTVPRRGYRLVGLVETQARTTPRSVAVEALSGPASRCTDESPGLPSGDSARERLRWRSRET
jgi:DNA-binding winged helix-turn-helix (wHTH) protein